MQREMIEQMHTVHWCRMKYPHIMIAASANGGSRNLREAVNLKKAGITAGIPDLQIFFAARNFHGLFLEMKAPKTNKSQRGRVTAIQQACLDYLNAHAYCAVAAWGFLEAKDIIDWYLNE